MDPESAEPLLATGGRVDEHQLIRRVLDSDPAAERELYDAHVDRVFRLAYRMTGDAELAQEFTQDTFVRAFQRLSGFRGEAALSTWLHSIAVSVVLNGLRKVRRNRQREVDLEHAREAAVHPAPGEPRMLERLKKAIDGLSDRNRTVFVMHDIEGFTHEEIGSALRVTTGTSKSTLFRARAKLREQLAPYAKDFST
ncbi:MAG TPA: RNA polymerase sigma factor [Longimicrobiaceae bacterium]|nr:RNA polymerase sigma factor [Longimicrobiaceae bacterium]